MRAVEVHEELRVVEPLLDRALVELQLGVHQFVEAGGHALLDLTGLAVEGLGELVVRHLEIDLVATARYRDVLRGLAEARARRRQGVLLPVDDQLDLEGPGVTEHPGDLAEDGVVLELPDDRKEGTALGGVARPQVGGLVLVQAGHRVGERDREPAGRGHHGSGLAGLEAADATGDRVPGLGVGRRLGVVAARRER